MADSPEQQAAAAYAAAAAAETPAQATANATLAQQMQAAQNPAAGGVTAASGVLSVPTDASGNAWGGDPLAGKALDTGSVPYPQQESDAMAYYNANPQFQQYVQQAFAGDAWMLQNPELLSVMVAAAANGWGPNAFNAALGQTQWWAQNGQAARTFIQLQGSDPASAGQQVAAAKASLLTDSESMGVQLNDGQLTDLATKSAMFAWTTPQMDQALRAAYVTPSAGGQLTGDAAGIAQTVKTTAGDYLLTADPNMVNFWTTAAVQKGQNSGQVQAEMQQFYGQQTATRYPWMAAAISQGMTPKDYLSPYTTQAASTLSVAPDSINWSDPKWQSALLQTNPDGSQVPKNTDQFNKSLMQDPQFQYSKTQNAINQAYSTVQTLLQTFGATKS